MKKSILNLGKALNKAEQKEVNGGGPGAGATTATWIKYCTWKCNNSGNSSNNCVQNCLQKYNVPH